MRTGKCVWRQCKKNLALPFPIRKVFSLPFLPLPFIFARLSLRMSSLIPHLSTAHTTTGQWVSITSTDPSWRVEGKYFDKMWKSVVRQGVDLPGGQHTEIFVHFSPLIDRQHVSIVEGFDVRFPDWCPDLEFHIRSEGKSSISCVNNEGSPVDVSKWNIAGLLTQTKSVVPLCETLESWQCVIQIYGPKGALPVGVGAKPHPHDTPSD